MKSGVFNAEQRVIFNQVIEPWGAPTISIAPKFYSGIIAGSEFLTYNVNKLYLFSSVEFSNGTTISSTLGIITLYNEANAVMLQLRKGGAIYDGGAAAVRLYAEQATMMNMYFSRIDYGVYNYMKFTGYIITR